MSSPSLPSWLLQKAEPSSSPSSPVSSVDRPVSQQQPSVQSSSSPSSRTTDEEALAEAYLAANIGSSQASDQAYLLAMNAGPTTSNPEVQAQKRVISAYLRSTSEGTSGWTNSVNSEACYLIIGRGFSSIVDHVTLVRSKFGKDRVNGLKIIHVGYPD